MAERRIRILQVGKYYPPHSGGMETYLQQLCVGLSPDFDVEVLVANDQVRSVREVRDGAQLHRTLTFGSVRSAPLTPLLPFDIRRARADVIHLHYPHPAAMLAYAMSAHPARVVVTYHSDIVLQRLLGSALWPLHRHVLDRADAIIASSPNYIESSPVLQRFAAKCRVIPFGIDASSSPPPEAVDQIRAQHGDRLVLAVGRLVYYKGFEHLVRAMAHVDAKLLLIGEGPLRGELERLAESVGATAKVSFLGRVPDTAPYYRAAELFVLPSVARSEAFGIVQLEAMAAGCPVVNTALESGVPWVSLDGESGLTVPPRDEDALASAISRLLDDVALRGRLAQGAIARVQRLFTLGRMITRTAELYESLAGAGVRRGASKTTRVR